MGWLHLDMSVEAYTTNAEGKTVRSRVQLPRPLIVELDKPFYYLFTADVMGPIIVEVDAHSCELADHIGEEMEHQRAVNELMADIENDQRDGG